ncbi:MAG: hypothetical protein JXJ20_06100 [Anaerolineae bacterium]|jgi:hypothetical protein|nr:hypothetical protein [Anaerolineae bacterium]
MLDDITAHSLFSLAELSHLRLEATKLFDECLTSGDESAMVAFIEAQVLHEPPRLHLMRGLASDLQQRLLSLQAYHFDVRDRVVRTFNENYGVDLTPLAPSNKLDQYHHLTSDQVLAFARQTGAQFEDQDEILLRKMVAASIQMAAQLYNDILMTTRLHQLVLDWVEGMHAAVARQYWESLSSTQRKHTHH